MQQLLADLGDPQRSYPASHVVGTNGKTSTTLLTAELLRAEGMLANERFVQGAPDHVIAAEREKLDRYRRDLQSIGG